VLLLSKMAPESAQALVRDQQIAVKQLTGLDVWSVRFLRFLFSSCPCGCSPR
jgi:hypothetical protein